MLNIKQNKTTTQSCYVQGQLEFASANNGEGLLNALSKPFYLTTLTTNTVSRKVVPWILNIGVTDYMISVQVCSLILMLKLLVQ